MYHVICINNESYNSVCDVLNKSILHIKLPMDIIVKGLILIMSTRYLNKSLKSKMTT